MAIAPTPLSIVRRNRPPPRCPLAPALFPPPIAPPHPTRHLPDQAALSFNHLAATRQRRRSLTSTRSTSASRRTPARGYRATEKTVRTDLHRAWHPPDTPRRRDFPSHP